MPIEGFDYKANAANLVAQLKQILLQPNSTAVPNTVTNQDKAFIVEIVKKFSLMCGEALYNDPNIKFSAAEAGFIVQLIAEWTFHKSIDMITGGIPNQLRAPILQNIALNVFNTVKLALVKKLPQDKIIPLVEEKVKQVYAEELQKLVKKGVLSEQQYKVAMSASNLDKMEENIEEKRLDDSINAQNSASASTSTKKALKLASLAIVLKNLPEQKANEIINILDKNDVQHIINYMKMSNLEEKVDPALIIKTLEEVKQIIPVPEIVYLRKALNKYRKVIKATKPEVLSNIALNEREAVKDFILDSSYPALDVFSPLLMKSLIKNIEEKINDY